MNRYLWLATRSTGIVAVILMIGALLWGLLFSARSTGNRLRPAWWLDLHNWLGGASLAFTGVHVVATLIQQDSGIGLLQVLVPGPRFSNSSISWGVIATYLLGLTVLTTWPRRLGPRRWWRLIHLLSVPATVLAMLHGYQAGTDRGLLVFKGGLALLGGVAVYGLSLRILGLFGRYKTR